MKSMINGKVIIIKEDELDGNLLEFIREKLDLTGTKKGCEIGACGVCTILVNYKPVQSCRKIVRDIIDCEVLTIEGLENSDGTLHPLQQAFIDVGAIQCGYCTPAMVLRGHALLTRNSNPNREEIQNAINPVFCRCTGYQQIMDAIESVSYYYKDENVPIQPGE